MKNLKLLRYEERNLSDKNVSYLHVNENDKVFVLVYAAKVVYQKASKESIFTPETPNGSIIGAELLQGLSNLIIALDYSIVLWDPESNSVVHNLECPRKINCVCMSPDQSVGVIVDESNSVQIITNSLEVLTTCCLDVSGFGAAELTSVGWGSKETQFHGSIGKEAALRKPEEPTPLPEWDDKIVEVAWRPDGQYFCVCWVDEHEREFPFRKMKFFSESGELHSIADVTEGLELGLCWQPPNGMVVASRRRKGRSLDLVFFERNGHRHREVELLTSADDEEQYHVDLLAFDRSGSVLAVACSTSSRPSFVRVLTSSNYHWSVKWEFTGSSDDPVVFSWSMSDLYWQNLFTLHVADRNSGRLCSLSWDGSWYDRGSVDDSLVAVVDRHQLRLTPISKLNIPPPMCAERLVFRSSVTDRLICVNAVYMADSVVLSKSEHARHTPLIVKLSGSSGFLLLLLSKVAERRSLLQTSEVKVSQQHAFGSPTLSPALTSVSTIGSGTVSCLDENFDVDGAFGDSALNWTFVSDTQVVFTSHDGTYINVLSWELDKDTPINFCLHPIAGIEQASGNVKFASLLYHPGLESRVVVQLSTGALHVLPLDSLSTIAFTAVGFSSGSVELGSFSTACQCLFPLRVRLGSHDCAHCFILGFQKTTNQLFAIPANLPQPNTCQQPKLLMDFCSSVSVHNDFLLTTSLKHELRCVPLQFNRAAVDPLLVLQDISMSLSRDLKKKDGYGEMIRPLENGSVIVACTPDNFQLVLQMPRGNLETVQPRPLLLNFLSRQLRECHFAEAAATMRKHRINFNLMYDLIPTAFVGKIRLFIDQLGPSLLTLFISDLSNEDLTTTMYAQFFQGAQKDISNHCASILSKSKAIQNKEGTKINKICDALTTVFLEDPLKFVVPLVTCYCKKEPEEIATALAKLSELRDSGKADAWEAGLKHLQYLCSADRLYKIGLGTYDLSLAKLLAARTQMDPKEYMPVLTELAKLAPDSVADAAGDGSETASNAVLAYQRARIDMYVGNFKKALANLCLAGDGHWHEAMELIKLHDLYEEAFELVQRQPSRLDQVAESWAVHLVGNQRLAAAAKVHLRAARWRSAAELCLGCNEWTEWCVAVKAGQELDATHAQHISADEVKLQAVKLSTKLRSLGQYVGAITVARDVLLDVEAAASYAIEGGAWKEARLLIRMCGGNKNALTQSLRVKLAESAKETMEFLRHAQDEYRAHFERLLQLRSEHRTLAEARRLAVLRGEADDISDSGSDVFSEVSATTVASGSVASRASSLRTATSSRLGSRSGKARRKADKPKWNLKPGSALEEVALMEAMHKQVGLIQSQIDDINRLMDEVWLADLRENSLGLLQLLNNLLSDHSLSLDHVWDAFIRGHAAEFTEGDGFLGRKTYDVNLPFMRFAPSMSVLSLKKSLFGHN